MRLGQDLAQVLGEGRPLALTRIEVGFALRASGVALALLDDRVMIIQWARTEKDLRRVQECVARSLSAAFLVEDAQAERGHSTSGQLRGNIGEPLRSPKPVTTMTLKDLDESLTMQPTDDRHIALSGPDDDENADPSI